MIDKHGTGSKLSIHTEAGSAARPAATSERAGEHWFGVNDARIESRRSDPLRVIGSAHGPRLLELLRAS